MGHDRFTTNLYEVCQKKLQLPRAISHIRWVSTGCLWDQSGLFCFILCAVYIEVCRRIILLAALEPEFRLSSDADWPTRERKLQVLLHASVYFLPGKEYHLEKLTPLYEVKTITIYQLTMHACVRVVKCHWSPWLRKLSLKIFRAPDCLHARTHTDFQSWRRQNLASNQSRVAHEASSTMLTGTFGGKVYLASRIPSLTWKRMSWQSVPRLPVR